MPSSLFSLKPSLLLTLLGASLINIATAETQTTDQEQASGLTSQWVCEPDASGGWACSEHSIRGRTFTRPIHPKPRSRAASRRAQAKVADEPQLKAPRNLDWVDESNMTPAQRQSLAKGCCGAYVEPARTHPDGEREPAEVPLRASATRSSAQDQVATLEGNVQVAQGHRQARSDRATVDQSQRQVTMEGNVQFREPNLLMLADRATVNLDTGELAVDKATWVVHDASIRGTAERLTRDQQEVTYIDNATYTTCEPGNSAWQLAAKNIRITPDDAIATARHVRVKVRGVPVAYTPWLRYPVDGRRASGLLFPVFDLSDENGFDYAQPIYLNLAPNYDATVTPRYLMERGAMLELEMRHLSHWGQSQISGGWLPDDDGGDDSDEDGSINPLTNKRQFEGEDRWLVNVDHDGGWGRRWNSRIDYTKVSDTEYFEDIGSGSLQASSETHLLQLAKLGYSLAHWNFAIEGVEYQTLPSDTPKQYQMLPRVTARGYYPLQLWNQELALKLDHQYTLFEHDNNAKITGQRLRADYSLNWDKQWIWGFVRPGLAIKHISYDLDDTVFSGGDDKPSVTVPVASLDAGLFFERSTTWLQGYTQTFEPRLYYLNAKYEEQSEQPVFDTSLLTFSYQQLFRDDRFSGGDRIGDADQLTVGLTSRLIDSSGVERLRGSIGQIFYFDDRFVSLSPRLSKSDLQGDLSLLNTAQRRLATELLRDDSEYAAEFAARLGQDWRFQADLLYDDETEKVDKGNMSLRYHSDAIFNFSYRYTRRPERVVGGQSLDADIDQVDISAYLPLGDSWSLVGRWNEDITNSRELEVFAGIEYNSCCWRTALLIRHWIDRDDDLLIPEEDLEYDDGIFIQFQFKGLAGSGTRVENILRDGIYGYQPPRD